MTFEIEVRGRTHAVTIERAEGPHRFRVTLDGVPAEVDAVRAGSGSWSLVLPSTGAVHDVALANGTARGELALTIDGQTVTAVVNGRRARHAGPSAIAGAELVTAPMPGKVLRVLVRPGDQVTARQPILVIEAMKMENELSAARGGTVTEVHVVEQALVEAGQLLLVVDG